MGDHQFCAYCGFAYAGEIDCNNKPMLPSCQCAPLEFEKWFHTQYPQYDSFDQTYTVGNLTMPVNKEHVLHGWIAAKRNNVLKILEKLDVFK